MGKLQSEYREIITEAVLELDAASISFGRGGKHPFADVILSNGRSFRFFFCGTPSGFRGRENTRATVRRRVRELLA